MGILKDSRFWIGVVTGYLLLMFLPQLSVRSKVAGRAA
jgi:hypothetical protein